MATLAENAAAVKVAQVAIDAAIVDKGGTTDGGLTNAAAAIRALPSGGGDIECEYDAASDGYKVTYNTDRAISFNGNAFISEFTSHSLLIFSPEMLRSSSKLRRVKVDTPNFTMRPNVESYKCLEDCPVLEDVDLPTTDSCLGTDAFWYTPSLTRINCPHNVKGFHYDGLQQAGGDNLHVWMNASTCQQIRAISLFPWQAKATTVFHGSDGTIENVDGAWVDVAN